MMHRIEGLELRGLGPFERVELEFPARDPDSRLAELHLFTGQNGTGKTTLLHALAVHFAPRDKRVFTQLLQRRRASAPDWYTASTMDQCTLVACDGEHGSSPPPELRERDLVSTWIDRDRQISFFGAPRQTAQRLFQEADQRSSYNPRTARSRDRFSYGAFAYAGVRALSGESIDSIREIESSPFENALVFYAGDSRLMLQWVANAKSKAALLEQRGEQDKADHVSTAIGQIELAVSEIIGDTVSFLLDIDPLRVQLKLGGQIIPFDVLPEGLKSILSWLADLIMRLDRIPWKESRPNTEQPFVLFLDEVDVHLHPSWQRKVLPAVQKLFPNAQIFATTHSPFVVGSVSEGWIYRFDIDTAEAARFTEQFEAQSGNSIEWILDEILGVPQQFDVATEEKLARLRELREEVLSSRGQQGSAQWREILRELLEMGDEVRAIAASEKRQVARLLEEAGSSVPESGSNP